MSRICIKRTEAAEERISTIEGTFHPLSATVRSATDKMAALKAKLDDLENRSCLNKLRFVDFPERSEGSHPERFLHSWLQEVFGVNTLSPTFVVEQAHYTPSRLPPTGVPPHTFLMCRSLIFKIK